MNNTLYTNTPRLILGFHGCEEDVAQKVLQLKEPLKPSVNDYDWLGNGAYFWENDPIRALEFAKKNFKKSPAVIGAVIDLGNCLNLSERHAIQMLKLSYANLKQKVGAYSFLPQNIVEKFGYKMVRRLDCAVIENLHQLVSKSNLHPYDTVMGAFGEGDSIYEGTNILEQSHVQVCVRNMDCIKGYFLPISK